MKPHVRTSVWACVLGCVAALASACSCSSASSLRFDGLPDSTTAGNGLAFTLTAVASDGKTAVTGYNGTVYFVSDDSGGTTPGNYAYLPSDQGAHQFAVAFVTAGSHTLIATDTNNPSITGQATINVTAGDGAVLTLVKGGNQRGAVGATLKTPLVVNVVDQYSNVVPGVTITWGSIVPGAKVNPATSQTADDGNAQTVATLGGSPGFQTFTATSKGLVGSPLAATEEAVAAPPASIAKVSGDNQSFAVKGKVPQPLVVKVTDQFGNASSDVTVTWSVTSGGGSVLTSTTKTDFDGLAQTVAVLGSALGTNTFQASAVNASGPLSGSPLTFTETGITDTGSLTYTDPPAGGKIRLVQNPATTSQVVVLDLVAAVNLTGWAVGFDLPLDGTKVQIDPATPISPGTVLPAGTAPVAAAASLPVTGPYSNLLSSGQSQKASGNGATAADTAVAAGGVFYTITLDRVPGASAGAIFDGSSLAAGFRARMKDKLGNDVAVETDFAIGKLVAN